MSTFWYWDGKEFFKKEPKNEVFTTIADDTQAAITSDDIQLQATRENTQLRFKRDDFELNYVREYDPLAKFRRLLIRYDRITDEELTAIEEEMSEKRLLFCALKKLK